MWLDTGEVLVINELTDHMTMTQARVGQETLDLPAEP